MTYIEDGDVFYNTETGQLQVRKNGAWTSLTKTITDTNAFKITSGTSLPSGTTTTTTTTTINNFNTDLGETEHDEDDSLLGQQHTSNSGSEPPYTKSLDLTTFGTNSGSLIGSEIYVYLRYSPGTTSFGDIQISQIKVNDVTYGITEFNGTHRKRMYVDGIELYKHIRTNHLHNA